MRPTTQLLGLISCLPLLACHTGSAETIPAAALMTGLAAGVSAARRSSGDCYVDCLHGTQCNRQTGLCDPLPCRGKCGPDESCEQTATGSACVPSAMLSTQARQGAESRRPATSEGQGKGADAKADQGTQASPAVPQEALQGARPQQREAAPQGRPGPTPGPLLPVTPNTPQPLPQFENPAEPPPR